MRVMNVDECDTARKNDLQKYDMGYVFSTDQILPESKLGGGHLLEFLIACQRTLTLLSTTARAVAQHGFSM